MPMILNPHEYDRMTKVSYWNKKGKTKSESRQDILM